MLAWDATENNDDLKTVALSVGEAHDVEGAPQWEKLEDGRNDKQALAPGINMQAKTGQTQNWADTGTRFPCGTGSHLNLLSKEPQLLLAPAILFCLIVALCSFGVVHATNASYDLEGEQAKDAALKAADGLAKQLSSASRAALSLAAVVHMNPTWPFLESNFLVLADELFRQSTESHTDASLALMELTLLPFGRVRAGLGKPIQRNSTADIFAPEMVGTFVPYKTMERPALHIKGPSPLSNSELKAFSAGYPIFFPDTDEDESWGHPDNITHPTGCRGPPCYDPQTRKKFWGFTGALVNADPLLSGDNVHLGRLTSAGLSYLLKINILAGSNAGSILVTGGSDPDKVTANVTVALPGNSWELSVYNPRQHQIVRLRDGLLVMVVVMAFVLSGLLLLLLLSSKKASVYLLDQMDEKVSREALLGRQYDLIACFERTKSKSKPSSDGQQKTLARIAEARAAISDMGRGMDEDIRVQELLAEGSFGKVYKGQWRGADVAVKIILLPGNMSGREKREKMVVWEAAISSSLIHPNVCQTYHYRIKPVKESARNGWGMDDFGSAIIVSDVSEYRPKPSLPTSSANNSGSSVQEEVHSYEVHLVLEYCDRSSLRDALDAGVFMALDGLNFAAQLDCAMDVAKAMLHLHCNNVSDFGLSVRMDHLETHVSSLFQGTLTHMAPEVLLKGTCSKASDVYAFGIVLWELYTSGSPFQGVPPALLGHLIVKEGKRPAWPPVVPKGYRDLVEACWDQDPDARPTFEGILQRLIALRKELGTSTPPLQPFAVQRPLGRPCGEDQACTLPSVAHLQEPRTVVGPGTPAQHNRHAPHPDSHAHLESCAHASSPGLTAHDGHALAHVMHEMKWNPQHL
ncbi:hypothetical protein DUNSADRAFT_10671 [Dunaliella salina]|uniref:Protein kinase domain-containing protein n=1 Tax=Dunaliella salina TaxID=3046 RepID=A0ABQ7GET8_DUNSA|nr:hypothetical protein DUNSADRAFT_10671 [Dunaliella salina]|eukprot:KAF5833121.1 hypothetical protein DUNSADRAFT_10671 [Dunaliella salina]